MEEIPDIWRTEVWHPLSVHFPVALLLTATVFKVAALIDNRELWNRGGSVLLIAGTIAAWVSVYTGDLADGIVSRTLCDPTILKDHENAAFITGWVFSAATVVDLFEWMGPEVLKKMLLRILLVLLLITGSGFLIYVGHSGASLVYQQAAGVYKPTEDCREFY